MKIKVFQAILVLSLFLQSFSAFGYDRQQAVKYADKWTSDINGEKRNPAYHDYSGSGGDCTNYISQCLRDGRLRFDSAQGYVDGKGCWEKGDATFFLCWEKGDATFFLDIMRKK